MNGCILWTKSVGKHGYGQQTLTIPGVKKKVFLAHRVAWAVANGIDPWSLTPDQIIRHTCDNPICVNPEHLLLGTQSDNMQDMVTRNRRAPYPNNNALKTHCHKGHEFTNENTWYSSTRSLRKCKQCRRERDLRRKEKERARKADEDVRDGYGL